MRANGLRTAWGAGKQTVNGWLSIPAPFAAELMAHAGFDSLTIDLQHGLVDYQAAVGMLQAISTTPVVPLARLPWREAGLAMKLLDAGAYGLICPMVNTRSQAEEFVSFCNYAPKGQRSYGPVRAQVYAGMDYAQHANDTVLALAMIETVEALGNLDAVLSTPGLDGIYVGPADLSLSMGEPARLDPEYPRVVEAIGQVVAAAKRHGLRTGIHTGSVAYAKRMHEAGFDFVTLLSDARMMSMQAATMVQAMGKSVAAVPSGTY